jgi:predicted nucleic acid-binding protein
MSPLFLDSGYIIALELADDQHHEAAASHWEGLTHTPPRIITTSYVFDEIVTYFNSRDLHDKAIDVGNSLLTSPRVNLVHVNESLFALGWQYLRRHSDKRYSLTDCISFVLMNQMDIDHALAFDRHFTQAGFHRLP